MKKIKTDVVIIGNGGSSLIALSKFLSQDLKVVFLNPSADFSFFDLVPNTGLGLWNSSYRSELSHSLSHRYDEFYSNLKEIFPAPIEEIELQKVDFISVLSKTPIHHERTLEIEQEYFKLERKSWAQRQIQLLGPENLISRLKSLNLNLMDVAQVEGGVARPYSLWWNSIHSSKFLKQFLLQKQNETRVDYFEDINVSSKIQDRMMIETKNNEQIMIEADQGVFVFLTGDLLPFLKKAVSDEEEPWIQGIRKKRIEQRFLHFRRENNFSSNGMWIELGETLYFLSQNQSVAVWSSSRGPDPLERVMDESLRLNMGKTMRYSRHFTLQWEWKLPQFRKTHSKVFWATAFENDLFGLTELLWTIPSL